MIKYRSLLKVLPLILVLAVLAFASPAAAQSTVPMDVKPGDTIEIGSETTLLELVDLRNQSTLNPITELRQYKMDDPSMPVIKNIPVSDDTYMQINSHTLGSNYGRYYPYNAKDGVIRNSISFAPAPATSGQTVTATPTEVTLEETTAATTAAATTAAATTEAPLSVIGAIGALCISLVAYTAWQNRR